MFYSNNCLNIIRSIEYDVIKEGYHLSSEVILIIEKILFRCTSYNIEYHVESLIENHKDQLKEFEYFLKYKIYLGFIKLSNLE